MTFGCTRESAIPVSTIPKTHTQECLDNMCTHNRNSRLRFLILLPESDYKKWFYSYKDVLVYYKSNFPGILDIEHFEESDQLPYTIEEPVMPRQLYIMLPKERIYVPSDSFTSRYIRSKMRELVQIFVALRATSIKYIRYDSDDTRNTINADLGVPIESVSSGVQYENVETKKRGILYEIRLNPPNEPINMDILSQFYYLKREPSWKDMILRRMDGGVVYDKYTYWNREMKLLRNKFVQKLKCINLSVDYDWEKMHNFMVDYEVTYGERSEPPNST
jgi:hypothetical protein